MYMVVIEKVKEVKERACIKTPLIIILSPDSWTPTNYLLLIFSFPSMIWDIDFFLVCIVSFQTSYLFLSFLFLIFLIFLWEILLIDLIVM